MTEFRPVLLAAPHRLPFLVGSANLVALSAWWLVRLIELQGGPAILPAGVFPPALLHGPAMLFLLFAPFIFGFLLTVFPRWMGYPDLAARSYGPVALLLAAGSGLAQAGLWAAQARLFAAGLGLTAMAWAFAVVVLGRVALQARADRKPPCWHAWSALAALLLGLAALLLAAAAIVRGDGAALAATNRIAIHGFLMPVFLTVAHRMVPFFAGNVVTGYQRWRPDWLLGLIWTLLLAVIAGQLGGWPIMVMVGNGGLALASGAMAWKWWPRGAMPGLLAVLLWGLAWAPLGFALSALALLIPGLGRAPDHALLIGCAASLMVAMVTRVTHGHSGRELAMSRAAWLGFAAVQAAAAIRMIAALRGEDGRLLIGGAALFTLGLAPWALRHIAIYLRPRIDGKPG